MRDMNRVALVTGGTRGIGFGIAECLVRAGLDLAVVGVRDESAAAEALDALRQLGGEVFYVQADVGERDDRARLVEAVRERFGRLHVLINNAGVAPLARADILEATEESYERVMRINLQGPYFLTQACARWMIDQQENDAAWRGCIVNISSISATVASISRGEYCISKAGLSMATRLWATRLGEFEIPVYDVQPGVIETDMTTAVKAKYDKLLAEGLAIQPRWGTAGDVGRTVAALVRGDLPYSSGQTIMVDGGLTVPRL